MAETHERIRMRELRRLNVFSEFEIREIVHREWDRMAPVYKRRWEIVDEQLSVDDSLLRAKIKELKKELEMYKTAYEIRQKALLNIAHNPFL
jgi:hypothetical protein